MLRRVATDQHDGAVVAEVLARRLQRRRIGRSANANQRQRQRRDAAPLQSGHPRQRLVLGAGDDGAGRSHIKKQFLTRAVATQLRRHAFAELVGLLQRDGVGAGAGAHQRRAAFGVAPRGFHVQHRAF